MSNIVFETVRLVVRRSTAEDFEYLYQLNSDADVMRYIRPTMGIDEAKAFLQKNIDLYNEFPLLGRWATFDKAGHFVGSFAIIHIPGSLDIQLGYALLKPNWGKGYASELAARGVQYAIENGINPLYAITEDGNVASQKVLTKNAFRFLYSVKEGEKILFRYQLIRN
jgi:ribosomal-protein-alanine N-acetyltransferase